MLYSRLLDFVQQQPLFTILVVVGTLMFFFIMIGILQNRRDQLRMEIEFQRDRLRLFNCLSKAKN